MKVKLIIDGGKMQPGPAVAQQLGPMGINLGKVISDINTATEGFSGMKVPVEIDADAKTKSFTIKVFSPPVAELLKKEAGIEKGSGVPNNNKVGNLAFETILLIAKTKKADLLCKDLKSSIKTIVGSCVSLGLLIDNKDPKEIEKEIDSGNYKKEIEKEVTIVSEEKKESLKKYFVEVISRQEKAKKVAEEAAAAAEAAKLAAATATGSTPTATPTAEAGKTPAAAKAPAAATASAKPEAGKKEAGKKEDKKPAKK